MAPPPTLTPEPAARPGDAGHAEAHETLTRILGAIEEYVYTGEFLPGDAYRVVFAGPCREKFLGMSVEEARTARWADYVHPADMACFDEAHDGAHLHGRLDVEYRIVGADGCVRWVRDRGRMRTQDGRRFLDGSVLDVTAIRSAQEALEAARAAALHASQVDPLTGVFNRRTLSARLAAVGANAVGLLTLDVDHFKHVNDFYGHAAGDAVLVAVADRLRSVVRASDAVFRMGGEEFLLVLSDVPDELTLRELGEAVRRRVAEAPVAFAGESIAVTVSVGAAHSASSAGALDQLLAAADRAMYAAKRAGRNRVEVASADADDADGHADGGTALRLAEAMAGVAALHAGEPTDRPARRAAYAARVARRLGAAPPQVLRCRLAGLLLAVRAAGAVEAGEALVGAVPELRPVVPILREVSEPFDAPSGVKPRLEARIVAAVDAWLALAPDPERAGAGPVTRLAALSGTRLDPAVVDALGSVLARRRQSDAA